jgi:hypothetical protein
VEAAITELQAQIVDLAVSKDAAGDAVAEAASAAAELSRPSPAPEPASSSDEVSEVPTSGLVVFVAFSNPLS